MPVCPETTSNGVHAMMQFSRAGVLVRDVEAGGLICIIVWNNSNKYYSVRVTANCVAAQYTVNKTKLDEFSMVFYNNLLSLPLIAVLMWWYGEIEGLLDEPALQNPIFLIAACSSALVCHTRLIWLHIDTSSVALSLGQRWMRMSCKSAHCAQPQPVLYALPHRGSK